MLKQKTIKTMETTVTKEKRPYEAPELTTVTFKTERGYAASELWLGSTSPSTNGLNDYDVQDNETW